MQFWGWNTLGKHSTLWAVYPVPNMESDSLCLRKCSLCSCSQGQFWLMGSRFCTAFSHHLEILFCGRLPQVGWVKSMSSFSFISAGLTADWPVSSDVVVPRLPKLRRCFPLPPQCWEFPFGLRIVSILVFGGEVFKSHSFKLSLPTTSQEASETPSSPQFRLCFLHLFPTNYLTLLLCNPQFSFFSPISRSYQAFFQKLVYFLFFPLWL